MLEETETHRHIRILEADPQHMKTDFDRGQSNSTEGKWTSQQMALGQVNISRQNTQNLTWKHWAYTLYKNQHKTGHWLKQEM